MITVVEDLKTISPSLSTGSRVGIAFFTDTLSFTFDFNTCCKEGKSALRRKLEEMQLQENFAYFPSFSGDHRNLSPHRIDIKSAFQQIKSKQF